MLLLPAAALLGVFFFSLSTIVPGDNISEPLLRYFSVVYGQTTEARAKFMILIGKTADSFLQYLLIEKSDKPTNYKIVVPVSNNPVPLHPQPLKVAKQRTLGYIPRVSALPTSCERFLNGPQLTKPQDLKRQWH